MSGIRAALIRSILVLAFAGLGAFAAPAHAQLVMKTYNFDELRLALQEVGSAIQQENADAEGRRFLEAKDKSGLAYSAEGRVCDSTDPAQRCTGLNIVCIFKLKEGADRAKALELADTYEAVKVYVDKGDIRIARYVIFDNGITPGNLKTNLSVFIDIANKIWGKLTDAQLMID